MNDNYGRSLVDRVNYLINNLTEEDKKKYPRIENFIQIWLLSSGGSVDINEHTDFFQKINNYALEQMNILFKEKFNSNINPLAT